MRSYKLAAVLLALVLGGCDKAEDNDSGLIGEKTSAYSLFDPVAASPTIPFPFDGLFTGSTDGTLNIPNAGNVPFVAAANELDGFSTTASLFTDFIGYVDVAHALDINPTTMLPGVLLIDASTLTPLIPGVDYRLQSSTATDPASGTPLNVLRTRMLIEPLKPLKPATRYLVVVTRQVRSMDGLPVEAANLFQVIRSQTPVNEQTDSALTTLSPAQRATLEDIRGQFTPIFDGLALKGIARENIAIAWPFTTQSATKTLTRMAAAASGRALTVVATGMNTQQVSASLPPIADLYVGSISVPYYLGAPSAENPTAPLTAFWQADPEQPDTAATAPLGAPCAALAPSVSTTACYPLPKKQSDQTIPVLIAIPNAASGKTMPENGWPVVIFQHGVTVDRTSMIAIAPAFAAAGFATVAIDLPLHGVPLLSEETPTGAFRVPGVGERTFDLDLVDNTTGAAGPDGKIDASGTHFINLPSLLTSRDNVRQAVSDLLTLTRSVGGATILDGQLQASGISFDGTQIRYIGHSLGGIVATTFLGVQADSSAAVLAMPGGGIAKLLDASKSFGPRIAAGLAAVTASSPAASRIIEGNDNYETFMRFAQTAVDSADPLNFAAAAAAQHPLLMFEVVGDAVLPNCAVAGAGCPNTDTITVSGYLSGSDPLARVLGLDFIPGPAQNDALSLPATPLVISGADARNTVVRFAQGDHSSILKPTTNDLLPVTCEMQGQAAAFVATNGGVLKIGNPCPGQ